MKLNQNYLSIFSKISFRICEVNNLGSKAFLASGGTLEMNFVGQCHGPSQNDVSGLGLLLL